MIISYSKAGGNGMATPVLAGPLFLKVKAKLHFLQKQVAR